MPLDPREVRIKLEELSAQGGGSLVKRVVKSKINPSSRVLFIGLGGMGCKTINEIKGIYQREFDKSYVRFLAIDTDQNELDTVNIANGGNISADEGVKLYEEDAADLLNSKPPCVRQWLSDDVQPRRITSAGAQGVRVIGRIMLCGTSKYYAVKEVINQAITDVCANETAQDNLSVVLVAGISGGTGSGTFIDIGYMIRKIIASKPNSEFYGVFYTPDVQKSIPEIGSQESVWAQLQRNGYAALKELDYFVSVGNDGIDAEPVYSISLPGGEETCAKPLFNINNVFIISATPTMQRCEDIIHSTAESLLHMFQTGTKGTDGGTTQTVLSNLCNLNTQAAIWATKHIGRSAINMPHDPCGIEHTSYPAFMHYHFASFGQKSIYFPRNEMVAYCANEAFKKIYEVWEAAFSFDNETVDAAAKECNIHTVESIYRLVCENSGFNEETLRIKDGESGYPRRVGTKILGKVKGTAATKEEAELRVKNALEAIEFNWNSIAPIVNNVKGAVENPDFMLTYGPYGGIVLLTGKRTQHGGLVGVLTKHIDTFQETLVAQKIQLDKAKELMDAEERRLMTDHTPEDDELEKFALSCYNYSRLLFQHDVYVKSMPNILEGLVKAIWQYNNETFDIYVPVLDTVKSILNEDAGAIMRGELLHSQATNVYMLNAFNLQNLDRMQYLFSRVFDGYVDEDMVASVAQEFANTLFGLDNREKWANFVDRPDVLADEIRSAFNSVSQPLVSNMLEKLMVLIYANPQSINQMTTNATITMADIQRIWDNKPLRDNALTSAAQSIVSSLSNGLMVDLDVIPDTKNGFEQSASMLLLAETPNLNAAIERVLTQKYANRCAVNVIGDDRTCEYRTAITMSIHCNNIPLPMVTNMNKYAEQYFDSEHGVGSSAGRHLDEVTEKWQFNLPELYGMDAEKYFYDFQQRRDKAIPNDKRKNVGGEVFNQDKIMFEKVREACDFGIEMGYIRKDSSDQKYEMIQFTDTSPEFLGRIEKKLAEISMMNPGSTLTWFDGLSAIENDDHCDYHRIIVFDKNILADGIKSRQTNEPLNDFEPKNVHRLIRANIRNLQCVLETAEFFKNNGFFQDMSNLTCYSSVIKSFAHAYRSGLISEKDSIWTCKYSENVYDRPIEFFDMRRHLITGFDDCFKWFLVISAFSKVWKQTKVVDGIEALYNAKHIENNLGSCKDILRELKDALNAPMFTASDSAASSQEIQRYLTNSNYREYYSYPKLCSKPDYLAANVDLVIRVLEDTIRFDEN